MHKQYQYTSVFAAFIDDYISTHRKYVILIFKAKMSVFMNTCQKDEDKNILCISLLIYI